MTPERRSELLDQLMPLIEQNFTVELQDELVRMLDDLREARCGKIDVGECQKKPGHEDPCEFKIIWRQS